MTKLRQLRESAGASQTAFAAKCGISVAAYGPIERGLNRPTPRIAQLIEAALGENVADLIAEVERHEPVTSGSVPPWEMARK